MNPGPVRRASLSDRRRLTIEACIGSPSQSSLCNWAILKKRNLIGLSLLFALLVTQGMAATYTVTNLNDSGAGSLREAILAANTNKRSTIEFGTSGTINLSSPLPEITSHLTIDGSTAPGFSGTPVVSINFNSRKGLTVADGADRATIKALSLVGASNAAITLLASNVTIQGNYIGLLTNGAVEGNHGDGVSILAPSGYNLIGNFNPVASIAYMDTSDFAIQPVTAWQGIRNYAGNEGQYLICGTSNAVGLLYVGPISGGGQSYTVQYPGADTIATSVYGPDNLRSGLLRVVGSYRKNGTPGIYNYGFVWEGATNQLPSGGVFRTIAYPGASIQFTHSTMGDLAVGNALGRDEVGVAYIYNLSNNTFVRNIVFPGSKTTTAYGIWQNGLTTYTICGGYSHLATQNLTNQKLPLAKGRGYMVDYDSAKNKFYNWTSFSYPNGPAGVSFVTHFEGISSTEPGVYTLSADSLQTGSTNAAQGSWVSVRRNSDGTFDKGTWVDLNYPDSPDSLASSNSVYGYEVVGLVIGAEAFAYEATVNVAFRLSNVIAGNRGNGINISGSKGNVIAMNYIGTDPTGSANLTYGNGVNGILVTGASSENLIGGQAAGINNPTGSKNPANAVFQRPPQGNLISGNLANGVLINDASENNVLSGNFIGTDAAGTSALGNGQDGVAIDNANNNSLIGCTLFQNPFVFYNVIAGNRGNGLRVRNANDVTVQANFLGIGADNKTMIPNRENGLLVEGTSQNTQVGGVIPLGNVISGNLLNGIWVADTASNFISFNTFGGIAAFQSFSSPNGLDGILITSTGGNNTVRTCIISGNNGNGIEIGGKASGVQITDTSVGTNTEISSAIPNQGDGILIGGQAHDNVIGGFQPSVEPMVFVSGNKKYGIAVVDRAHDNTIFHSTIGLGAGSSGAIPNEYGGILLDVGTSSTTIGGRAAPLLNVIQSNKAAGLNIYYSKKNTVLHNSIEDNSVVGVFASGGCTGTLISGNAIENNGNDGSNNVDISNASGITFRP